MSDTAQANGGREPGAARAARSGAASARANRLKAALKANIARRKARTRGPGSTDGANGPDGADRAGDTTDGPQG
jgi:hypothetical protein